MQEINPEQVSEAVENGSVFIDVREPFEIAEVAYDLPNQLQIPLGSIQSRVNEIPKGKNIIVGCRSGGRSANACQFLMMQGYENVANLRGGMLAWMDHGLPTK
jgi:rhodanese-related sulfurtransferase